MARGGPHDRGGQKQQAADVERIADNTRPVAKDQLLPCKAAEL
jgi:hypothetical protein